MGKAWRKSLTRASHALRACVARKVYFERLSPASLSVFSLVPDLLFDCSRVLEYAKIRTVLQSTLEFVTGIFSHQLSIEYNEKKC